MAEKTLEERLSELYEKIDHRDQFFDKDLKTLIDGIRDAREHGGTASVDVTPIVGGYKIVITDSEGVEHVATVKDGGDAYEVYKSTVPEGQSPMTKEEWLETLKGADGATPTINQSNKHWEINGSDTGVLAEGHNPNLGTYLDTDTKPTTGKAGDYIYVVDTSVTPRTANVWSWNGTAFADTGKSVEDFGLSFGSGQSVPATKIKNEKGVEVQGQADVLSAEAGKSLNDKIEDVETDINGIVVSPSGYYINGTAPEQWKTATTSLNGAIIPISPNTVIVVKTNVSQKHYAVLKSNIIQANTSPDFSDAAGFTERKTVTPPSPGVIVDKIQFTSPSDAKYMWFTTAWSANEEVLPTSITFDGVEQIGTIFEKINELSDKLDNQNGELNDAILELKKSTDTEIVIEHKNASIVSNAWNVNTRWNSIFIPVNGGDVVTVVGRMPLEGHTGNDNRYAILTSDSCVNGESPAFSSDTDFNEVVLQDDIVNVTMPTDAKYLWVLTGVSANEDVRPTNIFINGVDCLLGTKANIGLLTNKSHIHTGISVVRYVDADTVIIASKYQGDNSKDLVQIYKPSLQGTLKTIFTLSQVKIYENTSPMPNVLVNVTEGTLVISQFSDMILASRFCRDNTYQTTPVDSENLYSSGFHVLEYGGQYYKTAETTDKKVLADGVELKVGDVVVARQIDIVVTTVAYDPFVLYDAIAAGINPSYDPLFEEIMDYRVIGCTMKCIDTRRFIKTAYLHTYGGFASMAQHLPYGYFPNGELITGYGSDKFGELTYNVGTVPSEPQVRKDTHSDFNHWIRRNAGSTIFESCFLTSYGIGDHSEIPDSYSIYWIYNGTGIGWKKVYHRVSYKQVFNAGDKQRMECLYTWFKPVLNDANAIVYRSGEYLIIDIKGAYSGTLDVPDEFKLKPFTEYQKTSGISSYSPNINADGIDVVATGAGSLILKLSDN